MIARSCAINSLSQFRRVACATIHLSRAARRGRSERDPAPIHLSLKNKGFLHFDRAAQGISSRVMRGRGKMWHSCSSALKRPSESIISRSIRRCFRTPDGENSLPRCGRGHSGDIRNQVRMARKNNGLGRKFRGGCVLFVQHLPTNARSRPFQSGSFVACAFAFSNCERATEGGIPRSSRFRWFA
jgi:hypothetical protein